MRRPVALVAVCVVTMLLSHRGAAQEAVFKAGVDIVEVAVTVTNRDERFVDALTKDDFVIYDDGQRRDIVTFSSERVPVSLGILLDVSNSMTDHQRALASRAINTFAFDLLGSEDELFLMEFAGRGRLLQAWTQNRDLLGAALGEASQSAMPLSGTTVSLLGPGTAVFDTVATALEIAAKGRHRKKAILVISDGKDTASLRSEKDVQHSIRASDVLVYALGVDGGRLRSPDGTMVDGGVDARTLRKLTDDTGGRTEVVKGFENLAPATARLADELNRHYVIGFTSSHRDGRWHAIKVEVKKRGVKIRARAGYIAS